MFFQKALAVLGATLLILVAGLPFNQAQGQGAIAIVDIPKILKGSSAANGLRDALESVHEKLNARRVQVEKDLRSEDVDLSRQRSLLAPDAFSKKQKQFQDKVANIQQELQEEQRKVEEAYLSAMRQIETVVMEIVGTITKEKGIALVFRKDAVVHSGDGYDISDLIVVQLNKKLPKVNLPKL